MYIYTFFYQAEDGIRDGHVTGVQTCALPILVTEPDGVDSHGAGQGDGAGQMEGLGDHGGGTDIEEVTHADTRVPGAVAVAVGLDPLGGDPVFDQMGVHGVRLVAGNRTVVTGDDDPVDASFLVQAHGQVQAAGQKGGGTVLRSEERRVGREWRAGWARERDEKRGDGTVTRR